MTDKYISCNIMGGLGNQLFQIFTTLSYAYRNNIDILFPYQIKLDAKRHTYWNTFLIDLCRYTTFYTKRNISNHELTLLPKYFERQFQYIPIPITDYSFILNGYFQSYRYFEKEKEIIFKMIQLREQQEKVREEFSFVFLSKDSKPTIFISMHFRLGDYVQLQHCHPLLPIEYYKKSLDYLFSFLPSQTHLKILYFCESNDNTIVMNHILYLKDHFKEEPLEFIKAPDSIPDWKQLLLMSICNHHIIANSTFSWWGAYFNNSVESMVCYPKLWFGPSLKHHILNDLFPNTWKKIDI
jgi:hypothetical protein